MIVAAVLFAYAGLLCTLVPRLLRGARWAERAPRLGILVWQAAGVSVPASAAMAGLALTVPTVRVSADLAQLLQACVMALTAQYASPGGAAAGAAGAVLALAVLGRTAWCAGGAVLRIRRERRKHREVLDLVGRIDPVRGVVVLDHEEPAAYCLPGRHRRTVITSGALRTLEGDQLDAVLAHERAHQDERHDAVLVWARTLARAFPRVPLFRTAEVDIARLVEMGFTVQATSGTARALRQAGISVTEVAKITDGSPHVVDLINTGAVDLVINTISNESSPGRAGAGGSRLAIRDGFEIRRAAVERRIPCLTSLDTAAALVQSLNLLALDGAFEVMTVDEYLRGPLPETAVGEATPENQPEEAML